MSQAIAGPPDKGAFAAIVGERFVWLLLALIVVTVSLVPLLYALDAAFYRETQMGLSQVRSLDAIVEVYTSPEYLGDFAGGLILAAIVTALSVACGVGLALLVARSDIGFGRGLELLIILPLFISPFTGLMSWVSLASENSGFINVFITSLFGAAGIAVPPIVNVWTYPGVVWVMFLFFCPFAYIFTVGSLRGMDSRLEEAARASGATPLQTLLRVTLPVSTPAIFAAALLIFVLAAELYTVPGLIGSQSGFETLPWRVYQDSTNFPVHLAHAAAGASLLLWVTVIGIWLQRRVTRNAERFVTVTGKGFTGTPFRLGAWRWLAVLLIVLYVTCAVVLPFIALILSSLLKYSSATISWDILTLDHYAQFFSLPNMLTALWNTIWLAVASALACVVLGVLISFIELRRLHWMTRLLAFIAVLPLAIPGLLYGVGLMWVFLKTPLYGTTWVLLLAYVAKFLPFGVVVSRSGLMQIHPELEQSARMSGASRLVALRAITMPLLKPTLIAIIFFVMLSAVMELSASAFLYGSQSQVLSVLTWHYMSDGEYQFAAAIGVIQTMIMIVLVTITRSVFGVQLERAFSQS